MFVAGIDSRQVGLRVGVAIGHEKIAVAVVVVVEKARTPRDQFGRCSPDPRNKRHIRKKAVALIPVQRVVLVGEIGDEKVKPTVVVVIAPSGPHAPLRHPFPAVRHPGHERLLGEAAVSAIAKKQVGRGVVGHEQVGPPVVVVVAEQRTHAVECLALQAGLFSVLRKGAVAVVAVKHIRSRQQPHRPAVHLHVLPQAGYWRLVVEGEIHVIGHVQIHVAIAVVIPKAGTGAPPHIAHASLRGHIGKAASAEVAI